MLYVAMFVCISVTPIDSDRGQEIAEKRQAFQLCYVASYSAYRDTVDLEISALNIFRLLIFRVVLFSSLEHTDEN